MQKIPEGKKRSQNLTEDCGNGSSLHAPFETKDEDWIQDDVHNGTADLADHREPRTAICSDDGIHCLSEDIERKT